MYVCWCVFVLVWRVKADVLAMRCVWAGVEGVDVLAMGCVCAGTEGVMC